MGQATALAERLAGAARPLCTVLLGRLGGRVALPGVVVVEARP
jgi:hypothetical protein